MHAVQNHPLHNAHLLNICAALAGNHKRLGCCSWLVQTDFLSEELGFKETKQEKNNYTPFGTQAHCLYKDYIKLNIWVIAN